MRSCPSARSSIPSMVADASPRCPGESTRISGPGPGCSGHHRVGGTFQVGSGQTRPRGLTQARSPESASTRRFVSSASPVELLRSVRNCSHLLAARLAACSSPLGQASEYSRSGASKGRSVPLRHGWWQWERSHRGSAGPALQADGRASPQAGPRRHQRSSGTSLAAFSESPLRPGPGWPGLVPPRCTESSGRRWCRPRPPTSSPPPRAHPRKRWRPPASCRGPWSR